MLQVRLLFPFHESLVYDKSFLKFIRENNSNDLPLLDIP